MSSTGDAQWHRAGQSPPRQRRADAAPAPFPPRIDYRELRDVPEPLRSILATAVLPLDFAVTTLKIVKDVEELLAELTNHLRALRPAVAGLAEAYASGQFDAAFRTLDQIQHGASAIAFAWAPINAVREVVVPRPARPAIPATVPAYPQPAYPQPVYPQPVHPQPVSAATRPERPSTAEWLGGLGQSVLNQAEALPGGGMLVRRLRRTGDAPLEPELRPAPAAPEPVQPVPATPLAGAATIGLPVIGQAGAVLPGPLKRLLGAS
jgi:hypothetical protein